MARKTKKAMPATQAPIPITVREDPDEFTPLTVVIGGESLNVDSIDEHSEAEDAWWEFEPVVQMNYTVTLEDGREMSLSRNMADGQWSVLAITTPT